MNSVPPGEHLSPFEAQRKIHELLAQETRFRIIQTVLGHTAHLPSLAELAYYSQKSESAVIDQLGILEEHSFVTTYELPESHGKRDFPGRFYENTVKTEKIRRHETAPRPSLPGVITDALGVSEEPTPGTDDSDGPAVFTNKTIRELGEQF